MKALRDEELTTPLKLKSTMTVKEYVDPKDVISTL